jgi:molybdopterin-synthase adenylyltransferase
MPVGRVADEVHIAAERATWDQITIKLRERAPDEGCTFVLTRPSVGNSRMTVIVKEPIWPGPEDVIASPDGLEISADYISRALDAAIDAGPLVGLALFHTHPRSEWGEGTGRFSLRDDWYESRLFPTIARYRRQAFSASIVLGSAGDLDARIWWCDEKGQMASQPAEAVRVVGPELTVLETPSSTWTDHHDPEVMDRSTRLWGQEGRRRLQNLRAGIAGAGGTGSLTGLGLATMGAGKIRVWDKDVATEQNRHRTAGITQEFVNRPKVEGLKALADSVATAYPFSIETYNAWATTEEGLRQLKDCDVIFCCVDKLAARVPLNDLAYAHLIPIIDIASWIHADKKKRIDALMTHAHVWSPGIPCAWCRETLTSYALTQEAQGVQEGIEKRAPYGIALVDSDGVEPSVLPLNMLGVSLALMEFMQVALRITTRTPHDLKFILPEWELDESDRPAQLDCDCVRSVGSGETLYIAPVAID